MTVAFQNAIQSLRKAGVTCRPVDISGLLAKLVTAQRVLGHYEGSRYHRQRFAEFGDRLGYLAGLVREGLQISDVSYEEAKRVAAASKVRMNEIYKTAPVILVPAATGPALLGLALTGDARMNAPWTTLGTPAISIPMPVEGLPLGLQITGPHGEDARVLQAAVSLDRILKRN
jgi:Asp-tRNA(Asn)/Glu-tRNA(Gln) amidotransferase A subunit family amidase